MFFLTVRTAAPVDADRIPIGAPADVSSRLAAFPSRAAGPASRAPATA